LVDVVYEVYGGKDTNISLKPHLILICETTTSENALGIMFKRAKQYTDTYMIFGINTLSFKLQGVSAVHGSMILSHTMYITYSK
jgi:hypothetical protein